MFLPEVWVNAPAPADSTIMLPAALKPFCAVKMAPSAAIVSTLTPLVLMNARLPPPAVAASDPPAATALVAASEIDVTALTPRWPAVITPVPSCVTEPADCNLTVLLPALSA